MLTGKNLLNNNTFKKTFTEGIKSNDTLVRPPKGYDENNQAIEYLKMKSFIVTRPFTDKDIQNNSFVKKSPKHFPDNEAPC